MQSTINTQLAEQQNVQPSVLDEQVTDLVGQGYAKVNAWLDSRSDFYSRIMEESITWRQALRAGVVLPLLLVLVVTCITVKPLVALSCLAAAAWTTYRINKADAQPKKGGRR